MGRSLPRRTVRHIGAVLDTPRGTPAERFGNAGLATAAVGAGAVAARSLSLPLACPFLAVTGAPCPGCGMTRLADGVLHGHLLDAVAGDPLGAVLLAVLGVLALVGIAVRVGLPARVPPGRVVPATILAVLLVRWLAVLAGAGPTIS